MLETMKNRVLLRDTRQLPCNVPECIYHFNCNFDLILKVKDQKVVAGKLQSTLLPQGVVFLVPCIVINVSILFRWVSISRNSGPSNRQETSRRIQNAKTKTRGQQTVNKYIQLLNLWGRPYDFSPMHPRISTALTRPISPKQN